MKKCTILADDHPIGSHYEVTECEVEADKQEGADHKRVVGWNLPAMTEKDTEEAEKLWMVLVKMRAHLDAECPEDEVKEEAPWCHNTMCSILNASSKKIRIWADSKRW